eukprot:1160575-Pelagomonas_calceolata.AAC.7
MQGMQKTGNFRPQLCKNTSHGQALEPGASSNPQIPISTCRGQKTISKALPGIFCCRKGTF